MPYTPQTWVDGSGGGLSAARLTHMEDGILEASNRLAVASTIDYTVTTPSAGTYVVTKSDGTQLGSYSDTGTTSGLKAALTAILAAKPNYVHIHFGVGRFHFLDAPVGNESWASVEDHMNYGSSSTRTSGLRFTGEGIDATIISNRTNWSGSADTEPFSFTNCRGTYIADLTVESCGSYKSTTDAIDCDQGSDITIERVLIRRSRARGIVIDGGDPGRHAYRSTIRDVRVQGRPVRPELLPMSGGSLAASTLYDYVVTWVDQDLGGAGTSGETKPSDVATHTTDTTNKTIRVFVPRGSYNTTSRKVYRRSTPDGGWVLISTVSGNTDTSIDDNGLASQGAASFTNGSAVFESGIELLGTSDSLVTGCYIDGTGDATSGLIPYGINVVRKSTVPTQSNRNRIIGNWVNHTASHGIRVAGGDDNIVALNVVRNPGTVAVKAQALRIEGVSGVTSNRNQLVNNRCLDDQTSTSPSGGASTGNSITITSTNTPTSNVLVGNVLTGATSSNVISDSGTTSQIRDNQGHNPLGAASITPGASPYTYTAGSSPEAVHITGGVVTAIAKNSVTLSSSTGLTVLLGPNESVTVTYSSAPTMVKDRK